MIKTSLKNIQYYFLKVSRLFCILFKRRKRIEKISFGYYQNWQFENAYLVVDFKFKNAVWFRIGNFKSYDFSKQIVLDLENIHTDTINFEVFGFFQKQVYEISLNKEAQINTQSFKTAIHNINTVELEQQKTKICTPEIVLSISNPTFAFDKISMNPTNIQFEYNTFKIQDYI